MLERLEDFELEVAEEEVYGSVARGDYDYAGTVLDSVADTAGVPSLELLEQRFHKSVFRNSVECRNVFQGALLRAYLSRPNEYEQRSVHYFVRK